MLIECEVLRFDGTDYAFKSLKSLIVVEEIINMHINGRFYTSFHCLPSQIKELTAGYLLTEGIIENIKDIIDIEISGDNAHVELSEKILLDPLKGKRQITTIHGNTTLQSSERVKVNIGTIFKAVEVLDTSSSVYRASRGSHSAALIDGDCNVISFAEDIGRHNAVDKVVGDAALKGVDLARLLLALTGRLTLEIVSKAARVGIQILVSLAAPTSLGMGIANNLGLTLIGLVGKRSLNIYTFPERIKETEGRREQLDKV